MAVKKDTYVSAELDWAEEQLKQWRAYVDKNPFDKLTDRIEWRPTKTGTMPMVVASIEAQGKFLQETMKNFLALLEVVNSLREREAAKVEVRGKAELGLQADKFLKQRG